MNAQGSTNLDDGFSNNSQEINEEEVECSHGNQTLEQEEVNVDVKHKLPPPQQIRNNAYSLQPDIQTGWGNKTELPKPIPLVTASFLFDPLVSRAYRENNKKAKLVYLGPRYPSTYEAWHGNKFTNPYSHIKVPLQLKYTTRPYYGARPDSPDCLIFDSHMESGNLDAVFRIGARQYQLFLRVDSNTKGHIQWFNFTVKGLQANQKYQFHICNFQKSHSLYTRGAKPYILSKQKFQRENASWEQAGGKIQYRQKNTKTAKVYKYEVNPMFMLSFEYSTGYSDDLIQMAYSVPYTYTQLTQFLHKISQSKKPFLKISKLCNTLGGLEVPLLIINDSDKKKSSEVSNRKCVIVSARAHPGESNGSYMMQGFIEFLCGNTKTAEDLRKNIIFKIVPMLNPDGVILGNYRTGISGKDFNRLFLYPNQKVFPEVHAIKKLVTENKELYQDNLLLFLDFHGHSVKKNVFVYGPQFPITQQNYYTCRIFPKFLSDCTNMFRYYSCIFKVAECKESTARVVLLKRLGIPFSFTIQASNASYYDPIQLRDIPFNEDSWKLTGEKIAEAINQYKNFIVSAEKIKMQRLQNRKKNRKNQKNYMRKSMNSPKSFPQKIVDPSLESDFLSMEDQNITNLFREIEKIEQKRKEQNEKYSENNISQGSSDGQGEEDDLDENRLYFLYDIIEKKNKGKSHFYDSNDIKDFIQNAPKVHLNRRPIWERRVIKQEDEAFSYKYEQFSQQLMDKSQLLSKAKVNERKSCIFRSKKARKQQQNQQQKNNLRTPKIVSFGTGFLGFKMGEEGFCPDREKIDKTCFQFMPGKTKAGFLPNKIMDGKSQKFRKTYVGHKKNKSYDISELQYSDNSVPKIRNNNKWTEVLNLQFK